ncbi:MAG: aminotransferase class IV [Puniceicoccales bacterium]|nr:aminotransferase class IV [Puniceicoccales bacterium]
MKVYISGKLYSAEDAKVSLLGSGVRTGLGLRTLFCCRAGLFFHLPERLQRLREVAGELAMPFPADANDLKEALAATYDMNGYEGQDATMELFLIAGNRNEEPTVAIIATKRPATGDKLAEPIAAASLANFPVDASVLLMERNLLARAGTRLARLHVARRKAREAIILDGDGFISCCTGGELFALHSKGIWMAELVRPPITGQLALELFGEMDIKVSVQKLKLRDLQASGECFFLNELCEPVPISSIDGTAIGDGKAGAKITTLAQDFAARLRLASRPAF